MDQGGSLELENVQRRGETWGDDDKKSRMRFKSARLTRDHRSRYHTSSLQDRMGSRAHAHMHLSTGNWSNAEGSDHLLLRQQSRRDDHSTLNFAGAGAIGDSGRV